MGQARKICGYNLSAYCGCAKGLDWVEPGAPSASSEGEEDMVCEASNVRSGKATRAFFLDSEDGAARLLEGMELLNRSDVVVVFHRGSFPHEVKNKLELTSCSVEWVKCVDPGIKNSMDVQIIAELALRLAAGQFEDAYIFSEDKGCLPAIHYLLQTQQGKGCDIALAKNVMHTASRSVLSSLIALKKVRNAEDVEHAFALVCGECEAHGIMGGLERIFGDRASFAGLSGIGKTLAGKLKDAGVANPAELARVERWALGAACTAWIHRFLQNGSTRSRLADCGRR